MASISGYRSPVDLPIGQIPLTTDQELFPEMTDVYNAIHLINQYLDQLRTIAEGGGSGQTPVETLPFNRFFTATAIEPITAGMAISPSPKAGENGMIPGALMHSYTVTTPLANTCFVATTSGAAGQDIRVGVGPGAVALPGAVAGQLIWAYSNLATNAAHFLDGNFYLVDPGAGSGAGTAYAAPVGIGIATDYALIGNFFWRP